MHTTRRFTLVELLTVIGIIAVLMGILLPAVATVQKKAKITQAKGDMQSLMTAIKMYEATYGYLPVGTAAGDVNMASVNLPAPYAAVSGYGWLIAALSQTSQAGWPSPGAPPVYVHQLGNLRGIRMLEVTLPGVYRDPWNQDYRVVIDADYSGSITAGVRGLASTVSSSVVVWSKGPDTADDATANNSTNKDNIYTVVTNWSNGGHVLR